MSDLTEQQEQEMIELAREGDPEANYNMSLWALEQAMAEPEEERWNRLAAKCLVKAAEGGYEPAQERMKELLAARQTEGPEAAADDLFTAAPEPKAEPAPRHAAADDSAPAPAPRPASAARQTPRQAPADDVDPVTKALRGVKSAVGPALGKVGGFFRGLGDRLSRAGILNISEWDAAKRGRVRRIAAVVCLALVVLLIILIATGRKKDKTPEPEEETTIPAAEVIETPAPVVTPAPPEEYPPASIRNEIAAASLDVYPEEEDYVTEAKTYTVASTNGLYLRSGTGQTYSVIGSMDNRTTVSAYAIRNGWALVKHNNVWGWCSIDYLN